jgi:hypothetical protein
MPGPQPGVGSSEVAAWWLAITGVEEEDTDAAATPANTIESARMRIASFILVTFPFQNLAGIGTPYN